MKWKRIERDKDGYATGKAMLEMQKALPIVLYDEIDNRYDVAIKDDEIYDVLEGTEIISYAFVSNPYIKNINFH